MEKFNERDIYKLSRREKDMKSLFRREKLPHMEYHFFGGSEK